MSSTSVTSLCLSFQTCRRVQVASIQVLPQGDQHCTKHTLQDTLSNPSIRTVHTDQCKWSNLRTTNTVQNTHYKIHCLILPYVQYIHTDQCKWSYLRTTKHCTKHTLQDILRNTHSNQCYNPIGHLFVP